MPENPEFQPAPSPEEVKKRTAKLNALTERAPAYDLLENITRYEVASGDDLEYLKQMDSPQIIEELIRVRDGLKEPTLYGDLQEAKIKVLNRLIGYFQNGADAAAGYDPEAGLPPKGRGL